MLIQSLKQLCSDIVSAESFSLHVSAHGWKFFSYVHPCERGLNEAPITGDPIVQFLQTPLTFCTF